MNAVGAIQLSPSLELVFYLDTYKGERFGNIRKFVTSHKYTGPTKNGIKLTRRQLDSLQKGLTDLSSDGNNIQERELLSIPLSKDSYISVRINYFKGTYGLDIRQYISTEKYSGPSKKGIRIPLDHINQVCVYCRNMLAALDGDKIADGISDHHEDIPEEAIGGRNRCVVEGVPDEFQKYFE